MKNVFICLGLILSSSLSALDWNAEIWNVETEFKSRAEVVNTNGPLIDVLRDSWATEEKYILTPKAVLSIGSSYGNDRVLFHWDEKLTSSAKLQLLGSRLLISDPTLGFLKVFNLKSKSLSYDNQGKPFTKVFLEDQSFIIINGSTAKILYFVKKGVREHREGGVKKNEKGLWCYFGNPLESVKHKVFFPGKNGRKIIPNKAPLIGKVNDYYLLGDLNKIWAYSQDLDLVLEVKPQINDKVVPQTIRAKLNDQYIDFITPKGHYSIETEKILTGLDLITSESLEVSSKQVFSTRGKLRLTPSLTGPCLPLKALESLTVYESINTYFDGEEWELCRRETGEMGWVMSRELGPEKNGRFAYKPNHKAFSSLAKLPMAKPYYQSPLFWAENPRNGRLLPVTMTQNRTKGKNPGVYWMVEDRDEKKFILSSRLSKYLKAK